MLGKVDVELGLEPCRNLLGAFDDAADGPTRPTCRASLSTPK
jgi:hypothetical protein